MIPAETETPVDALIARCAEALRRGERAACLALLDEHPEHRAELAAFLEGFDCLERQFAPLRAIADGTPRTAAEMPTLGAGDTAARLPQPGQAFGDYELLAEIARGGMGVVYKARQRSLNRIVALKMVLGGERVAAADRERFLIEARAVARLNHPHIVPVYEVGERDGQPYFTMEFLAGGSLREQADQLRCDPRAIARLMVVVARAIEHAHRRGILHRDLKPSNVLLDERGEPHVTDFGLAKRLDEESDLTQAGAIVGTPSYMAPEQASAATDLTTAVDVYGLGAVLYELLAGRPPFKGNTPLETMLAAMSQEPARIRKFAPAVDADLETICLKCLEKNPLARYRSADALADDLERWLAGQPIVARPATAAERLVKWSRRQPLLAGSLATVLATAGGLLILAGFLWQNAEARAEAVKSLGEAETRLAQADALRQAEAKKTEAEQLADEQRKIASQQQALAAKIAVQVGQLERAADEAQQRLVAAQRDARRTIYAADMQLAHVAWRDENVALVRELLDKHQPAAAADDLRGFEWRYLWRQTHAAARQWMTQEQPGSSLAGGVAVSPDGKTVATVSREAIKLWNLADGQLAKTIAVKDLVCLGLGFSDGGGKLVVAAKKRSANMENFMQQFVVGPAMKKEPFSLAALSAQIELRIWDLADDKPPTVEAFGAGTLPGPLHTTFAGGLFAQHAGDAMFVTCLSPSADGKRLALCGGRTRVPGGNQQMPGRMDGGKLLVWDLEKGQLAGSQDAPMLITSVAFSADGKQLAIGNADGAIGIGQPDLARPPQLLLGHRGYVNALQFSGDGLQLISGGGDSKVTVWDIVGGKMIRQFLGHVFPVVSVAATPDSELLVSLSFDGNLRVWDRASPAQPLVLRGHTGAIGSLAFSSDGSQLISVDERQAIVTWEVREGTRQSEQPPPPGYSYNPFRRLSRDGSLLAGTEGRDTIRYRPTAGGADQSITWKGHIPFDITISPDNRLLAARDLMVDGGMAVWSLADGKPLAVLGAVKGTIGPPAFSPDGVHLAASGNGGLLIWNWKSAQLKTILPQANAQFGPVAYSRDGRLLAAAGSPIARLGAPSVVEIVDVQSEQVIARCQGAGQRILALAFSPDGSRLATSGVSASQQAMLKLWDPATGRETFSAALPPCLVTSLAFSPDGQRLAAAVQGVDISAALSGRSVPGEIYLWDATPAPVDAPAQETP